MHPLLEIKDFAVHRRGGFVTSVPGLRLMRGEVAALYGPSGCGKTSVLQGLLRLLADPDVRTTGQVEFDGRELSGLGAAELRQFLRYDVIYLAQDAHAALDPLQPVGRQIEQATGKTRDQIEAAIGLVGVEHDSLDRLPHQVSGGQAQRAQLTMAFLRRPALVLADEPTASLDGGSYAELVQHLRELLEGGSGVLLATHDYRLLRDLDAAVLVADDGQFVQSAFESPTWPKRPESSPVGDVPVLQARGLRLSYGSRVVLDDIDFAIARGEIVAVVGENGAGKTTLARVLAAHRRPDAGEVQRPNRPGAVQLCCQDALGSLTPGMSLGALTDEAKAPAFDVASTCRELRLDPRLLSHDGASMSGGECRRAVLLRALAVQPDVLLLDEPTASLDRSTAIDVWRSILDLQHSLGLAIVLITHDLDLARAVSHRVVEVTGGRLQPC